jgi:NAD(P)-dependent dehydrogenase (short-subunit alcohol dehydrogenase family)
VDVRKSSQVTCWIEDTVATFGKLYGSANVAGVYRPIALAKCTDDDWDFSLDVNARGVFNCLRAQIANIEQGGSIVSTLSAQIYTHIADI